MSDQPPQRRSAKGGFAIVRPGTGVPSPPPPSPAALPRTTTDVGHALPLRSDAGAVPAAAPVAYDGFLTPVAAPPVAPLPTSPPPPRTTSAPPSPAPAAMTPEMSAALASLKRASTNPPRVPSSPPSSSPPSLPSSLPSSPSNPVLPPWTPADGASADANPWAALAPPPAREPIAWGPLLRRAGMVLGVLAVVGGGWSLASSSGGEGGGAAGAGGALDDAVQCKQTLVRGRDLICIAPPSMLTELPPADREARLARARTLGLFAGMSRIIFEDNGRTWRTLVLTAPPGTTSPASAPAASSPAASTPAASTPAASTAAPPTLAPPPSAGPIDTAAP